MAHEYHIPELAVSTSALRWSNPQDRASFLEELSARDGIRCRFCGSDRVKPRDRVVDFYIPLSSGGNDGVDNAILVCQDCATSRRRRPFLAYAEDRLSELSLHVQTLTNAVQSHLAAQRAALVQPLSPEPRNAAQELVSAPSPTVEELLADWEKEDVVPVPADSPLFAKPAAPTPPAAKPRFGEPGYDLDAEWDAA